MTKIQIFINIGRLLLGASFLALLGAWWTQFTGTPLVGMSQQHLFNDAIVLALVGIGSLVDGIIHARANE